MRIPTRPRTHGLSFNITPLIDVVLLLIIFFLAASHLARSESLMDVDLPDAEQAEKDEEQIPRRLIVTITDESRMYVGDREVTLPQVEEMIISGRHGAGERKFEVRIRSDRSVPYREIEPILLACARHGVAQVGFAVMQK